VGAPSSAIVHACPPTSDRYGERITDLAAFVRLQRNAIEISQMTSAAKDHLIAELESYSETA
jgi:hypothetical protein